MRWGAVAAKWGLVANGPLGLGPLGSAAVAAPLGSAPFGSADVVAALGSVPLESGPFAPGIFVAFGIPTFPSVALLIAFLGTPGTPGTRPLAPGITPLPGMVVSCFLPGTSCLAFSAAFFL